jgi:hypothetical protein
MGAEDPSDLSSLLDEEAFLQVQVDVSIENLTSGTGLIGEHRTYGEHSVRKGVNPLSVKLMEFRVAGVALDVPTKTGAIGHVVRINFDVLGAKLPFSFSAKGTVDKVEALDDGREKFEVVFSEYDREYFGALRSIFDQRQSEIEKFLEEVRG